MMAIFEGIDNDDLADCKGFLKGVGGVAAFGIGLVDSLLVYVIPAVMNIKNMQRVQQVDFAIDICDHRSNFHLFLTMFWTCLL